MIDRRHFTKVALGGTLAPLSAFAGERSPTQDSDIRSFASITEAINSPPETLAYVTCTYAGTKVNRPDYLATIDLNPASPTYSKVIHRLEMPFAGDELHHFGWNACSSCHGKRSRRYLVLPGLVSGRIHIVDTINPREPKLHQVITPEEIISKTKLTAPHTSHCLADGTMLISMLGNQNLEGPGGFLLLDDEFKVKGRWESDLGNMKFNYDFWYQPRLNVMISSEWAAPKTTRPGFNLEDVGKGLYGQHIHIWDWNTRKIKQSIDLGDKGLIPLEVRFHHRPDSPNAYVGAALSSAIWHVSLDDKQHWQAKPVIQVETKSIEGWKIPVPGLITDLVVSMDDRWLYLSNWFHGDIRQYDLHDPAKPRLASQLFLGGLERQKSAQQPALRGGPQMLQLSLDGKRLYVTDSLFSSWDNQFYPELGKSGSTLRLVDIDQQKGLVLNQRFKVDFANEPNGPVRAHEIRFPAGDSTSDIWS